VALEIAHQLQKKGVKVALLVILDINGPSRTYDRLRQLDLILCMLKFHLMQFLPLSLTDKGKYIIKRLFSFTEKKAIMKHESEQDFSQSLFEQSPQNPNKPLNENDELSQAWNSIDEALRNHCSKGYSGKVLLTTPTKSGLKSRTKDILWTDLSWLFPYCGWEKLLTGEVSLHKLDYTHADVNFQQNAEQIGQIICKACEELR
jgi:thioesterase domain-containing protein